MSSYTQVILASALVLAAVPAWAGNKPQTQPTYEFTEIAFPPGSGYMLPGAWGLNTRGEVFGNCAPVEDETVNLGFVYWKGEFTIMPAAPFAGGGSYWEILGNPIGANDTGATAGWYSDAHDVIHGCVYTKEGQWIALPDPTPDGNEPSSTASGINNKGTIVGYAMEDWSAYSPWRAWILRDGSYTVFDAPAYLNSIGTFLFGINDHDQIVGVYVDQDWNQHGFLLEGDHYTFIDYPDSALPEGSPEGTTVLWSYISAINNRGQMVGYYGTSNDDFHGYVYRDGVFTTLDFPGTYSILTGINDKGEICGTFSGGSRAFIARQVPPRR